jgi:hypothetical protein
MDKEEQLQTELRLLLNGHRQAISEYYQRIIGISVIVVGILSFVLGIVIGVIL